MVLYAERLAQNAPPGARWEIERLPALPVPFSARLSEILVPPLLLRKKRDGIVHVVDHSHTGYLRFLSCPTVVTVHDLIPMKAHRGDYPVAAGASVPGRVAAWFRWNLAALGRADVIVTPTKATADEVRRILGPIEAPIEVVHHGIDEEFVVGPTPDGERQMRKKLGTFADRRILLQVTNGHFYKNDAAVLETFVSLAAQDSAWVWVRMGAPLSDDDRKTLTRSGLADRFLAVGGPTDEIAALYGLSSLLLFPSWDEGFGWPPLEAMSRGCPVACTDRGALAETAAPAALLVPPDDPVEITRRIRDRFASREAVDEQIAAGRTFSTKFRWPRAVERMDEIYRSLADA